MAANLVLSVDFGQARDPTAIALVERLADPPYAAAPEAAPRTHRRYHLRGLERCPLNTAYPDVVARLTELLATPALRGKTYLVADATGCGRPVVDLLRRSGLRPAPVTIHGGSQLTQDPVSGYLNAPKRELISAAKVLLQTERLKIAAGLADRAVLIKELLDYRVTIGANGHDSYAADWREGAHDDLVFAVALASWFAERFGRPAPRPRPIVFSGYR